MVGLCEKGEVLAGYVDQALNTHVPISTEHAEEIDQHYDQDCARCREWMNAKVLRPIIPATLKLFKIRRVRETTNALVSDIPVSECDDGID